MQAKFANITSSPNEIVVTSSFHLEVANMSSEFQICIPYAMIEPLKDTLINPITDRDDLRDEMWAVHMAEEVKEANIELIANFVVIPKRIREVLELKVGDILPIDLPRQVTGSINDVPIIECDYGSFNGRRGLRVNRVISPPISAAARLDTKSLTPRPTVSQEK